MRPPSADVLATSYRFIGIVALVFALINLFGTQNVPDADVAAAQQNAVYYIYLFVWLQVCAVMVKRRHRLALPLVATILPVTVAYYIIIGQSGIDILIGAALGAYFLWQINSLRVRGLLYAPPPAADEDSAADQDDDASP